LGKKRGRPKKREAPAGVEPIAPAAWARIRQMVAAGALDPIHATEIGRLSYLGEITASQAAAGFRIAEIYGRYERSIGRRRSARSPSYEIGFGPGAEEVANEVEAARARSAAREWARLQDLIPPFPPIAKALLEALCVEDHAISQLHLPGVCTLLDRVAAAFGTAAGIGSTKVAPVRRARAASASNQSAAPPRANIEREVWRTMLEKLRPDLLIDETNSSYEIFCALRDRARLRRAKQALGRGAPLSRRDRGWQ
jgi:hypothetical protein